LDVGVEPAPVAEGVGENPRVGREQLDAAVQAGLVALEHPYDRVEAAQRGPISLRLSSTRPDSWVPSVVALDEQVVDGRAPPVEFLEQLVAVLDEGDQLSGVVGEDTGDAVGVVEELAQRLVPGGDGPGEPGQSGDGRLHLGRESLKVPEMVSSAVAS